MNQQYLWVATPILNQPVKSQNELSEFDQWELAAVASLNKRYISRFGVKKGSLNVGGAKTPKINSARDSHSTRVNDSFEEVLVGQKQQITPVNYQKSLDMLPQLIEKSIPFSNYYEKFKDNKKLILPAPPRQINPNPVLSRSNENSRIKKEAR